MPLWTLMVRARVTKYWAKSCGGRGFPALEIHGQMRTIIEQGRMSFHENDGKLINPFEPNTKEYNWLERGWTQALKRHRRPMPGEPGSKTSTSYGGSFREGSMAEKYKNMRDWSRSDDD